VIVFMDDDPAPMVFRSAAAARGWMELVDVKAGGYVAIYTADGRKVSIVVRENDFELRLTDEADHAGLRRMMREYHARSELGGPAPESPVAYANNQLLWHWEHRWPKWPGWLSRRIHGDGPVQI